jgi:Gpi18-like mannosyltransferase
VRTRPKASEGEEDHEAAQRAQAEPTGQPERNGTGLREGLIYCVKVFVGVRLALAIVAVIAVALLPDFSHVSQGVRAQIPGVPSPVSVPGWPAHPVTPGWHNLFTAWERLDALWFLKIATHGYSKSDASAAFFPLYPALIAALSFVIGGHPLAASLIISNGAFLAALMVLFALTRNELTEEVARRAVLYAAVFPTAFFFVAPYSESLFFLLVLLSFWSARHKRWELAGVTGALAALTRNLGVLLVPALAIEALYQWRRSDGGRLPVKGLAWSLAPAVAMGGYLLYWKAFSGDWLAPLHQQTNWQRHLANPLVTLGKGTTLAFRYIGIYPGGYHTLDWLITVPVLAAGIYAVVRFRPAYGVYAAAALIVPLASMFAARPLIAFSRYALPVFPIYWAFAQWTRRSRAGRELLVAASAALLGLMTLLFVNWYYVI